MSDEHLSERLADLEVRLTFIDDAVAALADADASQSQRLVAMEQALRDLRAELAATRASLDHDPHAEPPPPHY